jgi:hypothetical protein
MSTLDEPLLSHGYEGWTVRYLTTVRDALSISLSVKSFNLLVFASPWIFQAI